MLIGACVIYARHISTTGRRGRSVPFIRTFGTAIAGQCFLVTLKLVVFCATCRVVVKASLACCYRCMLKGMSLIVPLSTTRGLTAITKVTLLPGMLPHCKGEGLVYTNYVLNITKRLLFLVGVADISLNIMAYVVENVKVTPFCNIRCSLPDSTVRCNR